MRRSIALAALLAFGTMLAFSSWLPANDAASAGQGKGGEVIAKPTPTPAPKKTPPPKKRSAAAKSSKSSSKTDTNDLSEIAFWESIKNSTDPEDFKAYLKKYPKGQFADLAQNSLRRLEASGKTGDKSGASSKGSSANPGPPKPGTVVKNRIGMDLVWIPPGRFMMGSENGQADEKPVHLVTLMVTETDRANAAVADTEVQTTERDLKREKELLHANVLSQSDYDQAQIRYNEAKAKRAAIRTDEGFYMGKYEVTQGQWQSVMGSNPSNFKGDNLPVETVSWDDAIAFIARLNAQNDGFAYRLPTEAEWEYACRAGTTGDYAGDLDAMAWYGNNSGRGRLDAAEILRTDSGNYTKRITENGGQTHAVGTKLPNSFGLFDMHGNVWEWCQDWHHDSYNGAPGDGSAWLSGGEQKYRVLRGGSWSNVATYLRSAYRLGNPPDFRHHLLGFRVVAVR